MTAPPRRDGTTAVPDSGPRAARLAPMTNLPRHLTVFCTGLLQGLHERGNQLAVAAATHPTGGIS